MEALEYLQIKKLRSVNMLKVMGVLQQPAWLGGKIG